MRDIMLVHLFNGAVIRQRLEVDIIESICDTLHKDRRVDDAKIILCEGDTEILIPISLIDIVCSISGEILFEGMRT